MLGILGGLVISLQQFVFARWQGFPFTFALLVGPIYLALLLNFRAIQRRILLVGVIVMIIPVYQLLEISDSSELERFARTSGLWLFEIAVLMFARGCRIRLANLSSIERSASLALVLITMAVLAQSGIYYLTGSTQFYNLLGPFQYKGEGDASLLLGVSETGVVNNARSNGFFLEPSYCAYVVLTCCFLCFLRNRLTRIRIFLGITALLLTYSFSGFVSAGIFLLAGTFWSERRGTKRIRQLTVTAAILVAVGVLIAGYASKRVTSSLEEGSSTNYRLIGPLPILSDTLTDFPAGHPFGSVERVVSSYQIQNGPSLGTTLDNGFYLLIFYFGWFGLAAIIYLFRYMVLAILRRDRVGFFTSLYFALAFQFSGGVISPEFALMSGIVIVAARGNSFRRDEDLMAFASVK